MNIKALAGATLAAMLVGAGALAGSVIGNVNAQTTPSDPTTPSTTPSTGNPITPPTDPSTGMPGGKGFEGRGMRGGMGMEGFGGHGGPGGMGKGMAATEVGATNAISRATEMITLAKSDLVYATGKMDTASVQRWLDSADNLIKSAESAVQSSKYESAANYAGAAMELAMTAETQMGQTLGFDKLPSYSQRPQMRDKGMVPSTTLTQAQASRMLARTYENLVMQAAVLKGNSEASSYLTEAQNTYKTAYDAYTAGKYSEAVASARLAEKLAGVAHRVYNAANAPNDTDTPVTVPQPNF